MKKAWWFTAGFFVMVVLLTSGAVFAEGGRHRGGDDRVLVEMDDGEITMAEFQEMIDGLPPQSRTKVNIGHLARERFLEEMIRTRLFVREARRLKMDERSDVAAAIKAAIDTVLSRYYLKEHVLNRIRVTEEEIKAYMEKNPERFQTPETVRVRQILIRVRKDATTDAVEAARRKAEEILARARAGEDFVTLVNAYSEDEHTRRRGGDTGYVKRGKMGKEFDDTVFNLKPGEVSPVVRTRQGFGIFKVEERKPASTLTIKDVRPYITSRLKAEKERAAIEAITRELMQRYKVRIHRELLKEAE